MQKIKFENIKLYKADIVYVLMEIRFVYASHQKHTQVLECDKLIQILNNGEDEFTTEQLLCMKNILNDGANYFLGVANRWETGELSMNLMNKVCELFRHD